MPLFNTWMMCVRQICEDIPQVLDADMPGLTERPINVFLPRLLQVTELLLLSETFGYNFFF